MSHSPDPRHSVRRVQLPSGRSIEVVYFSGHAPGPAAAPAPGDPAEATAAMPAGAVDSAEPTRTAPAVKPEIPLHVCRACGSGLVYPTHWDTAPAGAWRLDLRCPDCEWTTNEVFAAESVEAFDEALDHATQQLVGDLRELTQANMEVEVERFVAALHADLIWPIDF